MEPCCVRDTIMMINAAMPLPRKKKKITWKQMFESIPFERVCVCAASMLAGIWIPFLIHSINQMLNYE